MSDDQNFGGVETISEQDTDISIPRLYKVMLINDDYTTMDFVVSILETVFKKSAAESVKIMLAVHNKGHGVCGIYAKQIAEAKVQIVHSKARAKGFPLKCAMEPE